MNDFSKRLCCCAISGLFVYDVVYCHGHAHPEHHNKTSVQRVDIPSSGVTGTGAFFDGNTITGWGINGNDIDLE